MMRSIFLAMVLLLAGTSFAQNFRLGFQASPHITWMSSSKSDIVSKEVRPGIKYGLEADFFIAGFPRYSLNTGFYVANHSFSAHYNVEETFFINEKTFNEPVDLTFKLNYLEVPLNIKLRSDQFYRMTFFGQFGLSNLFNISATVQSSDLQFSGDAVSNGINKRAIELYNLSMLMGGGVEYDVGGNTAINLGIQYSNGLIDVTSIRGLNEKTIFNSLRLVLGIMF